MLASWLPFRCLVFLLLAAAGFFARPAEAARRPFADIVAAAAGRHGVDPDLVHAVIAVESGYRATAQSPAGAQGLMQLMPGTQRDLGVSDAFDPRQNVDAGVAYLRRLTDEFGTVLALAAYNAGPGAVRRYNGIPPYGQTRAYVQAVLDRGPPAADAPATAEHDPSENPAHALSEAGLAEGPRADLRLQDGHRATVAAAGPEPRPLDAAADPDDRTRVAALPDQLVTPRGAQTDALRQRVADGRPIQVDGARSTYAVADTARLLLHHGMDRLTVDAELRRNDPGLAVPLRDAGLRAAVGGNDPALMLHPVQDHDVGRRLEDPVVRVVAEPDLREPVTEAPLGRVEVEVRVPGTGPVRLFVLARRR